MAWDHVCTLSQNTFTQHPKPLLMQLSEVKVQETEPYERKLVSNCLLRDLLVDIKPSDKKNCCLFSVLWEKLSSSFIILGTSFDMGIALDRCSPQTHLSGFPRSHLMCVSSGGRGRVKRSWGLYTLKTVKGGVAENTAMVKQRKSWKRCGSMREISLCNYPGFVVRDKGLIWIYFYKQLSSQQRLSWSHLWNMSHSD